MEDRHLCRLSQRPFRASENGDEIYCDSKIYLLPSSGLKLFDGQVLFSTIHGNLMKFFASYAVVAFSMLAHEPTICSPWNTAAF